MYDAGYTVSVTFNSGIAFLLIIWGECLPDPEDLPAGIDQSAAKGHSTGTELFLNDALVRKLLVQKNKMSETFGGDPFPEPAGTAGLYESMMNNTEVLKGILNTLCQRLRIMDNKSVSFQTFASENEPTFLEAKFSKIKKLLRKPGSPYGARNVDIKMERMQLVFKLKKSILNG